jgi:hypothetical protein
VRADRARRETLLRYGLRLSSDPAVHIADRRAGGEEAVMIFGGRGYVTQRTSHGVTISPVAFMARCHDCGERDKRLPKRQRSGGVSIGGIGEGCPLKNSVWERMARHVSEERQ